MLIQPCQLFLRRWLPRGRSVPTAPKNQGFTLIELLVAMVVGAIITGTLLYLVVELLQINRREELLTQTQQDMQRAIDYISRDASEAVFVYADPTIAAAQITNPPADSEPVLAFWRLDPLTQTELNTLAGINCDAQGENSARCTTLKVRQSTYTLVIYYHVRNANNSPTSIWGGPARIVRYTLPQYSNLATFTQTAGYSDPSISDSFATWTRNGPETRGRSAVLTDFVDLGEAVNTATACPTSAYRVNAQAPTSFYTCTLDGAVNDPNLALNTRTSQSMRVFLRGNASTGRFGIVTFSNEGKLPTLESEVLVRGVIQRQPGS